MRAGQWRSQSRRQVFRRARFVISMRMRPPRQSATWVRSKRSKSVFGRDFAIAVSATKSATGHLLGAAGGLGAIFSILAIRDQVAPPTLNLSAPDPAGDGMRGSPGLHDQREEDRGYVPLPPEGLGLYSQGAAAPCSTERKSAEGWPRHLTRKGSSPHGRDPKGLGAKPTSGSGPEPDAPNY